MDNLCVSCGTEIPEGQQVCPVCAAKSQQEIWTGEAYKKGEPVETRVGTYEEMIAWADQVDADDIRIKLKAEGKRWRKR